MRTGGLLGLVAVVLGAAACGDPPPRPPVEGSRSGEPAHSTAGARDAGAGAGTDGAADAGGLACTTLENDGPLIEQHAIVGDPPPGSGGEVEDGTYVLVESQLFVGPAGTPGPTGRSLRGAVRITGDELERVLRRETSGGAGFEIHAAGVFTEEDGYGEIALTCPTAAIERITYSALGTTLILTDLGAGESFTFTRQ